MSMEDYLNEMKRDFGYGRCEEVPEEIKSLLLNGEEDDDNEDYIN